MSNNYYKPAGFGGFRYFPPVIKNLIIINVIVFLVEMLGKQIITSSGLTFNDIITQYFALIPLGGLNLANGMLHWSFYPWQLITYQFMHGGFWHIFWNMFFLWMFGIEIENLWGSKKFLTFYLMCGVAAGISQLIFPPLLGEPSAPTIGASGAIFGVLIAFAMLFPNRYIYIWFLVPIKAKYVIAAFVLLEFFSIDSPGSDIAHLAHLGGALAGFIYIMLDKNSNVSLGGIFRRNPYGGGSSGSNIFNSFKKSATGMFKKKDTNVEEARFYEVNDKDEKPNVTQEEIDRILDKISESGYQNLTEKEKRILFEASKKMK